jgi:hypothetical protein
VSVVEPHAFPPLDDLEGGLVLEFLVLGVGVLEWCAIGPRLPVDLEDAFDFVDIVGFDAGNSVTAFETAVLHDPIVTHGGVLLLLFDFIARPTDLLRGPVPLVFLVLLARSRLVARVLAGTFGLRRLLGVDRNGVRHYFVEEQRMLLRYACSGNYWWDYY